MGDLSPWHGLTADQLARPGHDPATCPICAPHRTPAAARGIAAARANESLANPQEHTTP